jgi:hypothetical protein
MHAKGRKITRFRRGRKRFPASEGLPNTILRSEALPGIVEVEVEDEEYTVAEQLEEENQAAIAKLKTEAGRNEFYRRIINEMLFKYLDLQKEAKSSPSELGSFSKLKTACEKETNILAELKDRYYEENYVDFLNIDQKNTLSVLRSLHKLFYDTVESRTAAISKDDPESELWRVAEIVATLWPGRLTKKLVDNLIAAEIARLEGKVVPDVSVGQLSELASFTPVDIASSEETAPTMDKLLDIAAEDLNDSLALTEISILQHNLYTIGLAIIAAIENNNKICIRGSENEREPYIDFVTELANIGNNSIEKTIDKINLKEISVDDIIGTMKKLSSTESYQIKNNLKEITEIADYYEFTIDDKKLNYEIIESNYRAFSEASDKEVIIEINKESIVDSKITVGQLVYVGGIAAEIKEINYIENKILATKLGSYDSSDDKSATFNVYAPILQIDAIIPGLELKPKASAAGNILDTDKQPDLTHKEEQAAEDNKLTSVSAAVSSTADLASELISSSRNSSLAPSILVDPLKSTATSKTVSAKMMLPDFGPIFPQTTVTYAPGIKTGKPFTPALLAAIAVDHPIGIVVTTTGLKPESWKEFSSNFVELQKELIRSVTSHGAETIDTPEKSFYKAMEIKQSIDDSSITVSVKNDHPNAKGNDATIKIEYTPPSTIAVDATGSMKIVVSSPPGDMMILTAVQAQANYAKKTGEVSFTISGSTDAVAIIKAMQMANSVGLKPELAEDCKKIVKTYVTTILKTTEMSSASKAIEDALSRVALSKYHEASYKEDQYEQELSCIIKNDKAHHRDGKRLSF